MQTKIRNWRILSLFLLINVLIQIIGAALIDTSISTWFPTLAKASWNPPGWIFGPVWTLLYCLIAVAGWLIYLRPSSEMRTKALVIYWVQLGINGLWPYLFFYLKSPLLGLSDIVILLVLICWESFVLKSLSRFAFFIFIVYFLWILYAAILNGAIWMLNR